MRQRPFRTRERGMALLLTLFALVVLSVIGLGMMSATNMETSISGNYRDKQSVLYAVSSGLQEARDRIQPANLSIVPPVALPSLSAANVIYIVNPRAGETVAPWDINNTYKDTQLCQEHVLGLSGTAGVPCTELPSGAGWYSVVDDSSPASAPWNAYAPYLNYKWTRITLKANNTSPVPVNGNTSDGRQVCWDGAHQVVLPAGYGTGCGPNGSIASVTVTNGGTGYTSVPAVTIAAPPAGGTQASGIAEITPISTGQVASVTIGDGGYYTSVPAVSFAGGGGSGAAGTAVWSAPGAGVAFLSLTAAGTQCYAVAPTVAITGGGGSGATGSATLAGTRSCIASWNPAAHCSGLKNTTVAAVSLGGPGSGFTGTLVFDNGGHIGSFTIQQPGSGYASAPTTASNDTLTANGCTVTPNASVGFVVQSVSLTNGGSGYTSTPAVTAATGAGSAAAAPTATATLGTATGTPGQVTDVIITSPGTGYVTAPTVVFGAGTGGAVATANLGSTYSVTGITLSNAGSGYTSPPAIAIGGGGGSGSAASATLATGPTYGKVYVITTLAQTSSGARAMSQMEVAGPVTGVNFVSGMALAGPNPNIGSLPDSSGFAVSGHDANSCSETPVPDLAAMGGFDDPNANPPTNSVNTITSAIPSGRTGNYTGSGGTPSVTNTYGGLGDTMSSPTGLKALIDAALAAPGANAYGSNPGSIAYGTAANPVVDFVDGDLNLGGSVDGYGVLVVTGTLSVSGGFSWHGIVLVIGDGVASFSGGGSGQITGALTVARIWDGFATKNLLSSLGSPTISWSGGGGNGIQYDHCWADKLMSRVPFIPPPSLKPLKVLGIRTLSQ